jgi:polar amino acid transport system substrate-binding protein
VSLPRTLPAALACAALVAALAGCGASGNGNGAPAATPSSAGAAAGSALPTATKDDALAAKVPQKVSADGKIVFGTDASYAPNEFYAPDNNTTIIGMDVDLGTAVAQKLGLAAEFQNASFSGIIPGIQAGQYELGMSSFSVSPERVQTVDMVSYFIAGTSMAVKKGNPDNINIDDLCGKAVAVQAGTVQVDDLSKRNQACTAAGKPAIQVSELQAQTDVTLALNSSRVVAMLADSPIVDYAVKTTDGALEAVGQPYDTAPYGIVLAKDQGEFSDALSGAIQSLIADGTYKAILDKWNVGAGAIPTSQVNPTA